MAFPSATAGSRLTLRLRQLPVRNVGRRGPTMPGRTPMAGHRTLRCPTTPGPSNPPQDSTTVATATPSLFEPKNDSVEESDLPAHLPRRSRRVVHTAAGRHSCPHGHPRAFPTLRSPPGYRCPATLGGVPVEVRLLGHRTPAWWQAGHASSSEHRGTAHPVRRHDVGGAARGARPGLGRWRCVPCGSGCPA